MGAEVAPQPALILASASPRRRDLLAGLSRPFRVEPVEVDERALVSPGDDDPGVVALRIASAKYAAFDPGQDLDGIVITADTLVACRGVIMGKPQSDDELRAMLQQMSGAELEIATAVCVGRPGRPRSPGDADDPACEVVVTRVGLRRLEPAEIDRYVTSGEGIDKAGGLALQAGAGGFIDSVSGCWANVLGLPMCAVHRLIGADTTRASPPEAVCSPRLCGSRERQREPDLGSALGTVAGADPAAVTGHDLLDDRQPEA